MNATTRRLRPYFTRHWPALASACAATALLTAAELAKPWPLKVVIDGLLAGHQGEFTLSAYETRLIAAVGVAVLALAAVDAAARLVSSRLLQAAGERITHALRTAVYEHLQRLSLGFHQRRQKGDLVARVTGDANAIGELFAFSLGQMVQSILLVIGMVVVTLVLDPLLGLVSCLMLPVLMFVSVGFRRRIRSNAKRQRAVEGQIASSADEALTAMPVVKAFGSERFEHHRVKRDSARRMDMGIELRNLQTRHESVVAMLIAVGTALVLVVGTLRVAAGAMTPGELVIFVTYARMINSPLRSIAKEYTKAARVMAKADRLVEVLAADEVLEERPDAFRGPRARGHVALEGVTFSYGDDRGVLSDISIDVPAGSRVAFIGPSGAGKSTVGALIARFYDPAEGRVLLDGRDVRDCSLEWLRAQFGVVLQDTVLFRGTVEENIAYASGASPDRVIAAAKVAAAHDFISALPDGYRTMLGPQGVGLSGGQRQRIGIARTVLRDPPILLLDEPTTGLDVVSERQVLDALARLMEGRTTIVATHSLDLARSADRIIRMEDGRVVADGPPDRVLADGPRFARPATTEVGVRARRRSPVPEDPALPQLGRMLDPDELAERLALTLPPSARMTDVRIARVAYRPGRRVTVHVRAQVDGTRQDAVAEAVNEEDVAHRLRSQEVTAISELLAGRTPSLRPIVYDPGLDASLIWLPFDPAMPALSLPREDLAHRIDEAAEAVSAATPRLGEELREAAADLSSGDVTIERLGYKPGQRAALRVGGHVLKVYGEEGSYERAWLALHRMAGSQIPTAKALLGLPGPRVNIESFVTGTTPLAAADAAAEAGAFLRELQAHPFEDLPIRTARSSLDTALRRAELLRTVVPDCGEQLERIAHHLSADRPADVPPAPAHGDFHRDRLVLRRGRLHVLDFDHLCLAPPALDLATYAAGTARGRADDPAYVEAVLEALVAGYGGAPADLRWHLATALLARAANPFHRQLPHWPERVEALLTTTHSMLTTSLEEVPA